MQNKVIQKTDIPDIKGRITNPGWAGNLIWNYNRDNIKASKLRIKEWDYYCILSEERGIALTVSDMGYIGFVGITFFDFVKKKELSRSLMVPFPMGKWNLPRTSTSGVTAFSGKNAHIKFSTLDRKRTIEFSWNNFHRGKHLTGNIELAEQEESDSIVVATPFKENPRAFYLNQKINCLASKGSFTLGKDITAFSPEDSFGVLDWGRGVWTYTNTWYWGSASGLVNGDPFGFNIGYGFGDLSTHSENALFYKGKLHKLDRVNFTIPPDNFLSTWHFADNEGRFEMEFTPLLDRASKTDLLFIKSDQHQVFGRFSGKAFLDDGTELTVTNLPGFAEKVYNRW